MRKLILLFLVCWLPSYAAITSLTTQWEVRTTGSDSNGALFDPGVSVPGTDYSQQDSPQISYTDLIVGATTTQYTSVLNVVSSAIVGNGFQIVSGTGCNTGFFEVLSVSGIIATANASLGTAASVCTAQLGGGLLTWAKAAGAVPAAPAGGAYATVWIKSGTYSTTANTVLPGQTIYEGYQTTHGDIAANPALFSSRPLLTTATSSTTLAELCAASSSPIILIGVTFSLTSSSATYVLWGPGSCNNATIFGWGVKVTTNGQGSYGLFNNNGTQNTQFWDSEFTGSGNDVGIQDNGGNREVFVFDGCWFHGLKWGFFNNGSNPTVEVRRSVFSGNGYGLYENGGIVYNTIESSVFSGNANDGVFANGTVFTTTVANSVFYNNGGYGINTPNFQGYYFGYANAYGSNTTGPRNVFPAGLGGSDVALGACNPFVSTSNFALSTCGKAALAAVAFPGVMPAGTGYLDIGALQSQGSTTTPTAPHAFVQ
jgi:hypothetical protein